MTKTKASLEANQRYALKNKEKLKAANLKYRLANPELCMLRAARQRAQKRNLEFNISVEDIVIPDRCPILNLKLQRAIGKGQFLSNSPSLDRIDPSKGYIKGNVWVISQRANVMKSDATKEELILFSKWISKFNHVE